MNSLVKMITWILGITMIVVGILGFILPSPLFGLFEVSMAYNLMHIISGVIGLAAVSSSESYARLFLIVLGIVYGIVTILGFAMGGDILGLFQVNTADNYLNAAISLVSLGIGFGSKK